MKLCIIGHGRHGKDTCAELFRDEFGMKFEASSKICAELFLFDLLKDKYNYTTVQECWEDRVNHRTEWYNLICDYSKDDKAIVTKLILENNDCYVGIRAPEEFQESKELFDLIIWVDASIRLEQEPKGSMKLTKEMADVILENNGTEEEFLMKVHKFGKLIFKK